MTTSREHRVGAVADFAGGTRKLIDVDGVEVGVIEYEGAFYAYANVCPHQGGPVCEGLILGRVEADVDAAGRVGPGRFSRERIHLICPWHGVEYDLRTGVCSSDRRWQLEPYEVVRRGEEIYVRA
jgi:nitrite reductase/ring-hydroxylating ferredoxin subunit